MFERLKEYKIQHGDCRVPQGYKNDPVLARWVTTQRTALRNNKMLLEREAKLVSIGFAWTVLLRLDDMFKRQRIHGPHTRSRTRKRHRLLKIVSISSPSISCCWGNKHRDNF